MKKSLAAIFIFLVLMCSASLAVDNETLWNQAADSYDSGDYSSAIENYSRLLEKGYVNPELYYNLGNSYFKSDQIGRAIWAYRRSLLLDPDLGQAKNNLEIARSMNLDRIETHQGGFITDIWDFLSGLFGYNEYLLLFTAAWGRLALCFSIAEILRHGRIIY
jgi:tetratricopeptide (TPR) repeat protein